MLNTLAMIGYSSSLLIPEESRARKNTGCSQLEGLKSGSGEDQMDQRKVSLRKTLSLWGCSQEKEMTRVERAGSWPTSAGPLCLKAEVMAAWKPAPEPRVSCLCQMRLEGTSLSEEKGQKEELFPVHHTKCRICTKPHCGRT